MRTLLGLVNQHFKFCVSSCMFCDLKIQLAIPKTCFSTLVEIAERPEYKRPSVFSKFKNQSLWNFRAFLDLSLSLHILIVCESPVSIYKVWGVYLLGVSVNPAPILFSQLFSTFRLVFMDCLLPCILMDIHVP